MITREATFRPDLVILILLVFIWSYGWPISFLLPELGAWRFVLATIFIFAISALLLRKKWITFLGIPKNRNQILACIIAGAASFVIFYYFIEFSLNVGGYQLQPIVASVGDYFFGSYPLLSRTLWRICQPLNEEIVLRALFLGFFARYFTHRALLALFAALVFSLLHLILYYFGAMATTLDLMALLTLFFFALAANALFLTFNHIGFGFMIHMCWNWWRFSGSIVKDSTVLNEAQGFNALEGSLPVFVFVTFLSLACVAGLVIHDYKIRGRRRI